jgi:hypothetical protein
VVEQAATNWLEPKGSPAMARRRLVIVIAALTALAFGCSSSSNNPSSPNGGSSFSADVQPIFTANCTAPTCHGTGESQGLRLTSGDAYGELVNVQSTEVPTLMRVRPNEPDSSYIMIKLGDSPPVGERMPRGQSPLSSGNISTIRTWIEDGAQND